jgi:PKD domain-containing protein
MRPTRHLATGIALLGLIPGLAAAQGVEIDHKQVGCIVVGKYPKMNACFTPASQVARSRVYFRPEGTPSWYYVEMKSETPCYAGILPRPGKKLIGTKIDYYVEAQDRAFNPARTAEYAPVVVRSEQECKKDVPVAPFLNSATVAVFPAMPAGFVAGGIGTGAILGIAAAGAAVAGTAVAVSNNNNNGTTTTPAANTTTTAPPATSVTTTSITTTTVPSSTNHAPNAVLTTNPDPPQGNSPLTVHFDLCASKDPDGDPLKFFFDFGDGTTASGACAQDHIYTATSLRASGGGVHAADTSFNFSGSVVDPGTLSGTRSRTVVVHPPVTTTTTLPCVVPTMTLDPVGSFGCVPSLNVPVSATTTGSTNQVNFTLQFTGFCYTPAVFDSTATVGGPPFSTTMTVKHGDGCYVLTGFAIDACTGKQVPASNQPVQFTVDSTYGCGGFRAARGTVGWSSDLAVEGGRLQLALNGSSPAFPGRGRGYGTAHLRDGENRVEAVLIDSAGKPGLWRFDLMSSQAVVPGSIRVLSGDVVQTAADYVTFRLSGKTGERVMFVFQKK